MKNRKKYTSSELIEAIKNETSTQICNPHLLDSNKIKKNHFNWDEMNMDVYFDSIINNSNTEWMDININSPFNIEARYPFLDINLVEFLLNIPIEQKEQLSVSKYILRNSLKNLLPEKIYSRSTKSLNLPQLLLGLQKEKGNIMRYTNFEYLNQYEKTNKQKIEEDIKKLSKSTNETFYPIVNIAKLLSVELWLRSR
ncbi:asparagine synthase-related protein [Mammaliicoccus sciuri]|uniref:asparagine synthase-related protein n=1 Tax=Mammaliicoccus sciuri TaxID=1296 RepID=UPI001304F017|nr:asparagine synthase C-terminal domain-containing protein [Mammaliicoccus sciuri]